MECLQMYWLKQNDKKGYGRKIYVGEICNKNEMSVDETSVDKMYVDETSVGEMSVDETFVDEMSVDEMSVDEMSVDKTSCYRIKEGV